MTKKLTVKQKAARKRNRKAKRHYVRINRMGNKLTAKDAKIAGLSVKNYRLWLRHMHKNRDEPSDV